MIWQWKDRGRHNGDAGALGLDMLFAVVCAALIPIVLFGVFQWSSAAAADGEGGSTIPIPPPKRPTPSVPTQTPLATLVPNGTHVGLSLTDPSLSPATIVQTTSGSLIPLTGANLRVEGRPNGAQQVVFPFVLEPGQEIASIHDPESGTDWTPSPTEAGSGTLTIPLAGGQVPGDLTIDLGIFRGDGQETWAPVLRAALRVGPVEMESSGVQNRVVTLWADLNSLPPEIALDLRGVALDSALVSALAEAAGALKKGIASTAYAVQVETDLSNEVSTAVVKMRVDGEWARAWTPDRIAIVRVSTEDGTRVLETTYDSGSDPGMTRFTAQSVGGFSTFVLVALGDLTSEESGAGLSWAQWLGIGLGAVALAGLAGGAFLLLGPGRRV